MSTRTSRPLTILVVDDNLVIRQGLRSILAFVDDVGDVLEASDGQQALELVQEEKPDLVMLDVRMPVLDGLGALPGLTASAPVLMLTHTDESEVISRAVRAGARGYLVHGTFGEAELASAIRVCMAGGTVWGEGIMEVLMAPDTVTPGSDPRFADLTEREREIMVLIGRGLSNAEIGGELYLAEKTVKNHINRIYDKCGYRTRSEAIAGWLGGTAHA